ncbi:MAG: thiol reductant ABC exporter subunit CydC [Pseudomonadota bacterium]
MSTWSTLLTPRRSTRLWLLAAGCFAIITLVFGALLLGVAGWLIAASAMAGVGLIAMIDIFAPGAAIRAFAVGRTVSRYLERLIGHEATLRQLTELRVTSFRHLLQRAPQQLDGMRKGDTLTRLTRDIDTLDHLFPKLVLPTVAAVVVTLLAIVGYSWLDSQLGMITLLMFGLLIPLVLVFAAMRSRKPGAALAQAGPALRTQLAESIGGIRELKAVGRTAHQFAQIQQQTRHFIELQLRLRKTEAVAHGSITMIGYTAVWLLLVSALVLHANGSLAAPMVVLIVLSSLALVDAWIPLANGWLFVETCRGAALRLDELASSEQLDQSALQASAQPQSSSLGTQNLCFRYQPWGELIVDRLDLAIEPGRRIVISGDSGSGKSTLGKLLAGLLSPGEGQVLCGGVDLQTMQQSVIRSRIGYLPQQPVLFHDTLAFNLHLANPKASEAQMLDVLERVQLIDFFNQLPEGFDTWLGESGLSVSGGEARRLTLARLMLADYPVLILDEPISSLDQATACKLAEDIEPWLNGRTLVILSHDRTCLPTYDFAYSFSQGLLHEIAE